MTTLAFPQLANISFQYREDLDDQGQGKIDLKRLVLECRSRQSKAEANYENLKERKKAQRSKKDLVVNDPKQIVQLEKIKATKPVASIVDQPEGKVVSKEGIAVVVHDVVSVVKPRSLLASFSRVAEESDGAPDGLNANFDIDVVIRNQHNSGQTEVCDVVSDAKPRVLLSSFQCVTKASNREPNDLNGSFDSDVASRDELNRRIEMVSMNQSKDSDMDSDVDILTEVTNQANATVSDEATQRNRRAALSHDKKVRWLDDLDELGSEDAIEIKSKSARSLKQKGKFGAAVKTNDFGRVKGQSKTLGGGVPKRGSFDVERKHLEKKDRYKVSNRTNADERDHGKTVNVSLAKHDSKWGQDSSKVSLAKHDSMWDQDSSKVQVNEAGTSPRSRHIVVHSERKHIEKKDRNNVSYRTNAGEWDHGTTVKPSLAQHDSKSGQHSFKAKANETSKSPRGRHDAVCSSHLIRKQPAVATRFEKRNDSSNLGEDKATSRIRSKSSMVNETKKRKSSSHRADSPSHFHANEQENPMSRSHAGHKKDLDGIGKPFQSFQNNQEYSRSTEMLKTNKATIRSDHIIKTKKHANSMPVKTTDRTSVNIDKSAPKTSLFLEETRGKRTSEQTSGIPSQERAPKSRRRARSVPSTATSKPGLADFEDYTFNFGA